MNNPTDLRGERHVLEPNPAEGRGITPDYLTQLADYLLAQSRWARQPGLLPSENPPLAALPVIEHDLVELGGIRAIGQNGYPLIAPAPATPPIAPFDLSGLPEGEHLVHVCLPDRRVPVGPPLPVRHRDGEGAALALSHRAPQLVLALASDRTRFLDWLPIARVRRVRSGGVLRSEPDRRFHPPVSDMAAFAGDNAFDALVARGIPLASQLGDSALGLLLRLELQALTGLARCGSPLIAMWQAQRCLRLIREARQADLVLPASLESRAIDPLLFTDFMADLSAALGAECSREELPTHLVIAGRPCTRLAGPLERDVAHWKWSNSRHDVRFMNGLALYLPHALAADVPVIMYGRQPNNLNAYRPAELAGNVAAPGVAVLFPELSGEIDLVCFTVIAVALAIQFEQRLNEGHALYHW